MRLHHLVHMSHIVHVKGLRIRTEQVRCVFIIWHMSHECEVKVRCGFIIRSSVHISHMVHVRVQANGGRIQETPTASTAGQSARLRRRRSPRLGLAPHQVGRGAIAALSRLVATAVTRFVRLARLIAHLLQSGPHMCWHA